MNQPSSKGNQVRPRVTRVKVKGSKEVSDEPYEDESNPTTLREADKKQMLSSSFTSKLMYRIGSFSIAVKRNLVSIQAEKRVSSRMFRSIDVKR
jgi:hypothetical protein